MDNANNNKDKDYFEKETLRKAEKKLLDTWGDWYRNGYVDESEQVIFKGVNNELCDYLRSLNSDEFTDIISTYNKSVSMPIAKIAKGETLDSLLENTNSMRFKLLVGVIEKEVGFKFSYDFISFCLEVVGYEIFSTEAGFYIEPETLKLLAKEMG